MFTILDQRKQAKNQWLQDPNQSNTYRWSKQRKTLDGSSGSGKRGLDWIDLAKDRNRWWEIVNGVMNLHISYNAGNFLSTW